MRRLRLVFLARSLFGSVWLQSGKSARTPLSDQSTTYMKGTCQGIYTGAHKAVACLGYTDGI